MPSTASNYLELQAAPEIKAIYEHVAKSTITDAAKDTAYYLLCTIDSKLSGTPTRVFTQPELDFQINDYKSRIRTLIPDDTNLASLADAIVWRLRPVADTGNKQELFSNEIRSDAPRAAAPNVAAAPAPAETKPFDFKPFIIPGLVIAGMWLYKTGAFDGILNTLGIGAPVDDGDYDDDFEDEEPEEAEQFEDEDDGTV